MMGEAEEQKAKRTYHSQWLRLQAMVQEASHEAEILPGKKEQAEAVFQQLQISPTSLMGTIARETGGIFVDHGWIRFLGSGCERMQGNLLTWNVTAEGPVLLDAFIVAHDAVGGVFAMNGGAFPGEKGQIFYFSPKSLNWIDLKGAYSQLFSWALTGDLEQFYEDMRWPGWEEEVCQANGDQGIFIYPFLWSDPNLPISQRTRRAISMKEIWEMSQELAHQLKDLPPGTPTRIHLEENKDK